MSVLEESSRAARERIEELERELDQVRLANEEELKELSAQSEE